MRLLVPEIKRVEAEQLLAHGDCSSLTTTYQSTVNRGKEIVKCYYFDHKSEVWIVSATVSDVHLNDKLHLLLLLPLLYVHLILLTEAIICKFCCHHSEILQPITDHITRQAIWGSVLFLA